MNIDGKEYLPIKQYIWILSTKGINTNEQNIGALMCRGAIDTHRDDNTGEWYIAQHEMKTRIKERGKNLPKREEGFYTIQEFMWLLFQAGVKNVDEDKIDDLLQYGRIDCKQDGIGRWLIAAHELEAKKLLWAVSK